LGPRRGGTSVDKAFQYSGSVQRITERWDSSFGALAYEYDANGQLLSTSGGGRVVEKFAYDATGNAYQPTPASSYGPGNVLQRCGEIDYVWDGDGRLVEKVERRGTPDERHWRYHWNGAGRLRRVEAPDGTEVEYAYDPFARRVAKWVNRRNAAGDRRRVSFSRFLWDKDKVVHEIRESADERGDPVVHEKTYCYDENRGHPLAEKEDVVRGDRRDSGEWFYHVNDPIGTPEHMVDAAGTVACALTRTAWGRTTTTGRASTELRFAGQYDDVETGLHYNRYRYYDPDLGRFISSDPAGGLPDTNAYRYVINPINWVDPFGLHHTATATFTRS
jgi:RHS repeat-associated protein